MAETNEVQVNRPVTNSERKELGADILCLEQAKMYIDDRERLKRGDRQMNASSRDDGDVVTAKHKNVQFEDDVEGAGLGKH